MFKSASSIKKTLTDLIHTMSTTACQYVKMPGRDFTRERKLSFEKVITLILCMGGGSLTNELMNHFGCTDDLVSASALVQQRKKLSPDALATLFHLFVEQTDMHTLYMGYRLLAVDGSALQIPTDSTDEDSFYPGAENKTPYNLLHLNAMYDLLRHVYIDAIVQKGRIRDETKALISMVDRASSEVPAILMADRGFESYNAFAHIQEKGWRYLIRVKDDGVNGGITNGLNLPEQDEYDLPINLLLTRSQTKDSKQKAQDRNKYKIFYHNQKFDFLPQNTLSSAPAATYEISFRVVRFKISDDSYETVITNLDTDKFPPQRLKELYAMRWGIETSFRQLNHTVGLLCFHSKKSELICQEIFSRLIIYNFTELIVSLVNVGRTDRKHKYTVNFSTAVHICRLFLRDNSAVANPITVLKKFVSPLRKGRSYPRIQTSKSFASYSYRMA